MRKIRGFMALAGFAVLLAISLAPIPAEATTYGFNNDTILQPSGKAFLNDVISSTTYPGFTFGNGVRGITDDWALAAWGSSFAGIKAEAGLYWSSSGIFSITFPDTFIGPISFWVASPTGEQDISVNGIVWNDVGFAGALLTATLDSAHHTLTILSGDIDGSGFISEVGNPFTFDTASQVPLPGAFWLLSGGLGLMGGIRGFTNFRRHRGRGST